MLNAGSNSVWDSFDPPALGKLAILLRGGFLFLVKGKDRNLPPFVFGLGRITGKEYRLRKMKKKQGRNFWRTFQSRVDQHSCGRNERFGLRNYFPRSIHAPRRF